MDELSKKNFSSVDCYRILFPAPWPVLECFPVSQGLLRTVQLKTALEFFFNFYFSVNKMQLIFLV